jgi:multidrug efflux pump subunit AcrA (membrane-fusion protein)
MGTRCPLRIFPMTKERRHKQPALFVKVMALCIAAPLPASIAYAQAPSAMPPARMQSALPAASPGSASDRAIEQPVTVVVPASIQAFFVNDIYAKDSGYVSQVSSDIGDHVTKGQVLAAISDPELQAQCDKAEAAVQQAMAALDVAKQQLAGMQADLVLQRLTYRRERELYAGKAATPQTLNEAQAKLGVSTANVATGRAKIAAAEADLQAAKAEVTRLQALLQYDQIVAPFDGVITRRLINPGDLVQAAIASRTTPLFTIQEIDTVRVFADVPDASAVSIRPGLATEIAPYGATGTTVHGSVTRIATALDPATRTMRIEIDLPNHDGTLLPGMYAQVTLRLGPRPTAVGSAGAATSP